MGTVANKRDVVRVADYPFAPLPIWMLVEQNGDISDGAKVLWGYLRWRQGPHPDCWPSVARMAEDLGKDRSVILRRLAELEGAGYIKITRTAGRGNRYTVYSEPARESVLPDRVAKELHRERDKDDVLDEEEEPEEPEEPVAKTQPVAVQLPTGTGSGLGPVAKTRLVRWHKSNCSSGESATRTRDKNEIQQPETEDVDGSQRAELRSWLEGVGFSEQNAEALSQKGLSLRDVRAWWAHIREHNGGQTRNKIRSPLGFLAAKIEHGDRLPEDRVRALLPFQAPVISEQQRPDTPVPSADEVVWRQVLDQLQLELTRSQFDTYLRGTKAERRDGTWEVACRNSMQQDWMTHRMRRTVEGALSYVLKEPSEVVFAVQAQAAGG